MKGHLPGQGIQFTVIRKGTAKFINITGHSGIASNVKVKGQFEHLTA
jgi:hypothetical protein